MITLALALLFVFGQPASAQAGRKLEARYAYTMRLLKLDKQTAAKFGPVLHKYLEEMKEAGDPYDAVKDKYKAAEKAGTITDAQGTALMEAKLTAEAKELAVKKKYYPEFRKLLKGNKVYYAFKYSNDKMSKIEGHDKEE